MCLREVSLNQTGALATLLSFRILHIRCAEFLCKTYTHCKLESLLSVEVKTCKASTWSRDIVRKFDEYLCYRWHLKCSSSLTDALGGQRSQASTVSLGVHMVSANNKASSSVGYFQAFQFVFFTFAALFGRVMDFGRRGHAGGWSRVDNKLSTGFEPAKSWWKCVQVVTGIW
ncbi:hypothetical protein WMY93_003018 [Mugilogobius chulae]|uniref:Uncharacterized protein n=1 Tax=Mugilogobius chulae TaxID=88201 RepID=A0AAW0PYR9_9GOBI